MIKLRDLLNEEFTAISSKSGKTVVFKDKDSRDAAVKAGTHEVPEDEKGGKDEPKGEKPNMFSKDAGYDAPDAKSDEPKSDNKLSLSKRGIGFDMTAANTLEDELGGGISDINDNGDITFSFAENDKETQLYFGKEGDQFVVSVENPYGDDFGDMEYFDNEADAIAHAKELVNKYSKELGGSSSTNKYDKDSDEKEFENALESDGFSSYDGGSLEGTSTFGDDNGNTVAIAAGDVYDSKSGFVVSGFNDDDPADVIGTKEFDSKEEAIAYAKELGQELQKQNPPQKSEPKSDEPEVKGALPSDGETYQWTTGKKRMDVDKDVMKSVKKLSTKLKLNDPSRLEGGRKEYERKMLSLVHDALEDANFHGANRQIFADLQGKPELAKRPDYSKAPEFGTPEREEWDMNNSIYNKNFDSITIPMDDAQDAISDMNAQSGWDGQKTLAALLAKMRKDGAGILADKIQTSFETAMKNEEGTLKLGDLI